MVSNDTELRMIAAQITMMAVFLPLLQEYVRM